jgi:hypothetical protein
VSIFFDETCFSSMTRIKDSPARSGAAFSWGAFSSGAFSWLDLVHDLSVSDQREERRAADDVADKDRQ